LIVVCASVLELDWLLVGWFGCFAEFCLRRGFVDVCLFGLLVKVWKNGWCLVLSVLQCGVCYLWFVCCLWFFLLVFWFMGLFLLVSRIFPKVSAIVRDFSMFFVVNTGLFFV
jgi:hypothetical protein